MSISLFTCIKSIKDPVIYDILGHTCQNPGKINYFILCVCVCVCVCMCATKYPLISIVSWYSQYSQFFPYFSYFRSDPVQWAKLWVLFQISTVCHNLSFITYLIGTNVNPAELGSLKASHFCVWTYGQVSMHLHLQWLIQPFSEGDTNPRWGANKQFGQFFQKLHENEDILTWGCTSLAPPRSATDLDAPYQDLQLNVASLHFPVALL